MIIYSWNILFRNQELDRAFAFIKDNHFDFFCLQEVPEKFLKRLQTVSCFIAYSISIERVSKTSIVPLYNVILSKFPIIFQGEVPFENTWEKMPFRTKLFIFIMKPFHFTKSQNRRGMYVDVNVKGKSLRIFNLHLALAYPAQRQRELEVAMTHYDVTQDHIICGDFNIVEFPHIVPLNWLFGGKVSDVLLYKRERMNIEGYFKKLQLVNPLRGFITHPFSHSQLDHILIPKSFSVITTAVLPDRIGSDHCIIRVETEGS